MNKDSIILLQKVDCNCNDCTFMERDFNKFQKSLAAHDRWQFDYFNTIKGNLLKKAEWWQNKRNLKHDFEKGVRLKIEVSKMKYQFDKSSCIINFGTCQNEDSEKFKVTFIPNTLQLDTQDCFRHRREDYV